MMQTNIQQILSEVTWTSSDSVTGTSDLSKICVTVTGFDPTAAYFASEVFV